MGRYVSRSLRQRKTGARTGERATTHARTGATTEPADTAARPAPRSRRPSPRPLGRRDGAEAKPATAQRSKSSRSAGAARAKPRRRDRSRLLAWWHADATQLRQLSYKLTAVAVVVLAAAAFGVQQYLQQDADQSDRDAATEQAVEAARDAAVAVFSFDYRSFDSAVANGKAHTTGDFAAEYNETTGGLRETAEAEEARVTAEVSEAAVIEVGDDTVEVLLFVNLFRTNANIDGEKVDQNRVVLTMQRVDGEWKVAAAAAL